MINWLKRLKRNFVEDWQRIVTIIIVTIITAYFILKNQSSLTTVIILAVYVIFFLLIQLLNSNVISQNDKISVNVKIISIVLAIVLSAIFYKQNFSVISSLLSISLLIDVINQSVKIWYFHKNMVAVNELVIYAEDEKETNKEIPKEEVIKIISKIRPHYNYLHKKTNVKVIDGEMANRVREIVVAREEQLEQLDTINQKYLSLEKQSKIYAEKIEELNNKLADKDNDLHDTIQKLQKKSKGFWARLFS